MRVQDDPITSDSHWPQSPLHGLTEVTASAQITLPAARRLQFNLSEEDYLEAEAAADDTLLKPVAVVEGTKVREQFLKVMDRAHAKQPFRKKSAKEDEEDIAQEVGECPLASRRR